MDEGVDAAALRILDEVLELKGPDRTAHLDRTCAGDSKVLRRVEALLAAVEKDDAFLNEPTITALSDSAKTSTVEGPGAHIGPYKLLELIGQGGFGSVFMAQQAVPVRRRVALKIIKLGMDTRQVIARFEAERQALALMDHPNIAKVLDAGATESGRPYFVMELVRGEPVTAYSDRERLTITERLTLFCDICLAVQHAHQKGVIHRDLKPNNVLVTVADAKPIPKVIDFGIAKATASPLTDKTLFTEFRQLLGTPEYMSPEQAEPASRDIDTRSDIYSLGVLLYELLTGTTPFDAHELVAAGYDGMRRILRDQEPQRPSLRLQTLLASSALVRIPTPAAEAGGSKASSAIDIARRRQLEPMPLTRALRGDLDWIVLKCLEKDRRRRYETASALAEDVGRYLDHQPVLATPPSAGYKLRKFLRRNRGPVLAGAGFLLLLIGGMVVSFTYWQRAESSRAEEQRQRRQAESITEFVTRALVSSDPVQGGSQDFLVIEAMDQAIEQLDSGELNDQPETEAALRLTISQILNENARSEQALRNARRALEISEALHPGDHPRVARSQKFVAISLLSLGRSSEALLHFEAALEMRQRLFPGDHPDVAESSTEMARCLETLGRSAEALPRQVAALEMLQRLFPGDSPQVANSLNNVAACLHFLGRSADALPKMEAALEMHRRLYPGNHPKVAMCLNNVASCLEYLGRAEEALPHYKMALDMYRGLFEGDHPSVAATLKNWALCLRSLGRWEEALVGLQEALEMTRRLFSGDHPETAASLNSVGSCLRSMGRAAEALPNHEAALAMLQRLFPGAHPKVARSLNGVALCLQSLGRLEEALTQFETALLMYQQLFQGDHPQTASVLNNAASCLRSLGRPAEALPKYEAALAMSRRVLASGDPNTLHPQIGLAQTLVALGRYGDAEPLLRDAAAQCESSEASRREHWRGVLERSVELYDAWHAAEPDQGHGGQAAEWRERLDELQSADARTPAANPN